MSAIFWEQLGTTAGMVDMELDEDWLKTDGRAKEESGVVVRSIAAGSDEITPTGTFASLAQSSSSPQSPPNGTRLSGLFQGWLESNQRPAPPPSQASLASNASRRTTTDLLRDLRDAEVYQQGGVMAKIVQIEQDLEGIDAAGSVKGGQPNLPPTPVRQATTLLSSPSIPIPSFTSLSPVSGSPLAQLLPQSTAPASTATITKSPPAKGWSPRVPLPGFGGWGTGSTSGDSEADQVSLGTAGASLRGKTDTTVARNSTGGLWSWWTGAAKPADGSAEALLVPLQDA